MKCEIHGLEYHYSAECPACASEEVRQAELLEVLERQVVGQRRHDELLEAIRNDYWAVGQQRQVALEELVAAEEARLEESRNDRRRSEIRAGLLEFSADFQGWWYQLNKRMELPGIEEECLNADDKRVTASIVEASGEIVQIKMQVEARSRKEVEKLLVASEDTPSLRALKGISLTEARLLEGVGDAFALLSQSRYASAAGIPSELPQDIYSLMTLLNRLRVVLWRLGYTRIPVAPSLVLIVTVFCLSQLLTSILLPDSSCLGFLISASLASCLPFVAFAATAHREQPEAARFVCGSSALAVALLGAAPKEIESFSGTVNAEKVKASASRVRAQIDKAVDRLKSLLSDGYARIEMSQEESQRIASLMKEREAARKKQQEIRAQIAQLKAEREVLRQWQGLAMEMIREIGREVLEGIRVPGRQVVLRQCSHCHGWKFGGVAECQFCAARQAVMRE